MNLSWLPYLLEFKYPFGVSSNSRTNTPVVFTKLSWQGYSGYGEASVPPYLGENQEGVILFLASAKKILSEYEKAFSVNEILQRIDAIAPGNNAAKASIDIALNDLVAKISGKPYYEYKKLGKADARDTAHTIGIGDEKILAQKIKEAGDFSFLKIKLGTPHDKSIIENIRKHTVKPLYVDVNQGWKDKYFVIDMLHWLKEKNVLLVEQPMPVDSKEEMAWVKTQSPLPLIADESVKRLKDIDEAINCFHAINIKLMKSTGLHEAEKMIVYAKSKGLKIYLGCMGESSCAASAASQLLAFADFVDLDAPLLIKNDPFSGIKYKNGKVILNGKPGIGVETHLSF